MAGEHDQIDRVRKVTWGMLYGDNSHDTFKSPEGLVKVVTVIGTVLEAAGLTSSKKKAETMLVRTPHTESQQDSLLIVAEAAEQRYKQTNQFICFGRRCRRQHQR